MNNNECGYFVIGFAANVIKLIPYRLNIKKELK